MSKKLTSGRQRTGADTDILVTLSTFGEYSRVPIRLLEESGYSCEFNRLGRRMNPEEVCEAGKTCRGLIAGVERYSEETLSQMPKLKCISRCGAGTDNIDPAAAARLGVAVLNTPDEPVVAVAELTLGMILALLRRLTEVDALMHARKWQRVPGRLLFEKVVGIVGLGRIGKRVAGYLLAFGAHVTGADPNPDFEWARSCDVKIVELSELLEKSDIVTIHAAASTDAPLYFGRSEFAAMKPGAWFINLARGNMIDDAALLSALQSGQISGAGLDVFPEEPYTGPLCSHPGVILSPHQATLAVETRVSMEIGSVRNLIEYLKEL